MKLFINAATLKVGGGKSVLVNFLKSFDGLLNEGMRVLAVVPDLDECRQLQLLNIQLDFVPSRLNSVFNRLALDSWIMKKLEQTQPKVIFSMGNVALPVKNIPQLLLFHVPYPLYPESAVWKRMSLTESLYIKAMGLLIKSRMKYATHILLQTVSAQRRFGRTFGPIPSSVVPNGISLLSNDAPTSRYKFSNDQIHLLCLARYYPHKNVEVLLKVAELIRERNAQIRIVTTVSTSDGNGADKFINAIKSRSLNEIILNLGTVAMSEVPALYCQTDGLLLPTLLESYSQTYVESMYFGRPIFTSRLDFAVDVCGDNAYYFNPLDPEDIYNVLTAAFQHKDKLQQKVENARQLVSLMPTWPDISQNILTLIRAQYEQFSKNNTLSIP